MNLHIREAVKEDTSALKKLFHELTNQEIGVEAVENRLEFVDGSPFDSLFVCEEAGAVLGVLGFRIRENIENLLKYGEISVIVVDANAKRKGIGWELMDFAEDRAQKLWCAGTWLVSGLKRKEEAHRFYEDLGYEVTGHRFNENVR